MKKYEFTGETKVELGVTFKRIRRISDGEIGGWIEKEGNLSHSGLAWVSGNAKVYGDAWVSGNAQVFGDAQVSGKAWVYGDAQVSGNAKVSGDAQVSGNAWVSGDAKVKTFSDVINVSNLQFNLTVTKQQCSIGCRLKTHSEWLAVTEDEAEQMGLRREDYPFWKSLLTLLFERMK